jgi:hypothetical protein
MKSMESHAILSPDMSTEEIDAAAHQSVQQYEKEQYPAHGRNQEEIEGHKLSIGLETTGGYEKPEAGEEKERSGEGGHERPKRSAEEAARQREQIRQSVDSVRKKIEDLGGLDKAKELWETLSPEERAGVVEATKQEWEQRIAARRMDMGAAEELRGAGLASLNPVFVFEALKNDPNLGTVASAVGTATFFAAGVPALGASMGMVGAAKEMKARFDVARMEKKRDAEIRSFENREAQLKQLSQELGLSEAEAAPVLDRYKQNVEYVHKLREWAETHKKHLRAALAAVMLNSVTADTWYGAENFDMAKFASEELAPSTTVGEYVESWKEKAQNEDIEDHLSLADGRQIETTKERTLVRVEYSGEPIMAAIREKKTVISVHTHPAGLEKLMGILAKEEREEFARLYQEEKLVDESFKERGHISEVESKKIQAIAPSSTDVANNFVINLYKERFGVKPGADYVFSGAGVWKYSVDLNHPFWKRKRSEFQGKIQQVKTEKELEKIISYVEDNGEDVEFMQGYQLELFRTATKDYFNGDVSRHGTIRDIIHNVQEKYGVILGYAPYSAIEAVSSHGNAGHTAEESETEE